MASEQQGIEPGLRQRLLEEPDTILSDPDLMRALLTADEPERRPNIVDLRGVAMDRLESRLSRLEDTHQTVISAAYENLSGTKQVHRAILALIEQWDFEDFIRTLGTEVTDMLRVSTMRLVLETTAESAAASLQRVGEVVRVAEPGFVDAYIGQGRDTEPRRIVLRQTRPGKTDLYGAGSDWVASEACLRLDIGHGRYPAMLALGSDDPHHFTPSQGTDLLVFFGSVFEQLMRRWLA
ncbi:MAG: DUF484 family protein [Paracoccaceae bacterium]|nr:DUF484 family protein [Paracoccaceae bacterium]